MHAVARSAKPKLSLSISTASASSRPSLSLSTAAPRTPVSPSPLSPTARNTRVNQHRGYASIQSVPSSSSYYGYTNSSSSKSILKKSGHSSSSAGKRLQFSHEPTVYCITPIENKDDYYGAYTKMSREERRWARQ